MCMISLVYVTVSGPHLLEPYIITCQRDTSQVWIIAPSITTAPGPGTWRRLRNTRPLRNPLLATSALVLPARCGVVMPDSCLEGLI